MVSVQSGSLGQMMTTLKNTKRCIFNVHLTAIFPFQKHDLPTPDLEGIQPQPDHWERHTVIPFCVVCLLWAKLTYDGVGLRSKCTHTGGTWGHLELGEAPLGAEVLGKEAGWGQTAERAARQIGAEGRRSPSLRANIYPELPVRQQETQLTSYMQKAINRDQEERKNVTSGSSHWRQIEMTWTQTGEINAVVFINIWLNFLNGVKKMCEISQYQSDNQCIK